MNPNTTPNLWRANAGNLEQIAQVDDVRMIAGPVLEGLSAEFKHINSRAEIADPLLAPRLWALSTLSNEAFAVHGFEASDYMQYNGDIVAHVAPTHDLVEYEGRAIATRVVKLEDVSNTHNDIEIYGLNLYTPSQNELLGEFMTGPKLAVVTEAGRIEQLTEPVTGVTDTFAVRNNKTGITVVYRVSITNGDDIYVSHGAPIVRDGISKMTISTPDGRLAQVDVLQGLDLDEALKEFEQSASTIKQNGASLPSEYEADAVRLTLGDRI